VGLTPTGKRRLFTAHRESGHWQQAFNSEVNYKMVDALAIGDRVRLSGGYDMNPKWLSGNDAYMGTVSRFIPGQNQVPAAVVKLDKKIAFDGTVGDVVVLELRYKGGSWKSRETVHIELCDFEPDSVAWESRQQGQWIESHASFEKVK
jgi:hypothetical protein